MKFVDPLRMGSVVEIEEERFLGVEETIFVAVGEDVKQSETTLFWAVQNFAGKKICVLHVHQPSHELALCELSAIPRLEYLMCLTISSFFFSFGSCLVLF